MSTPVTAVLKSVLAFGDGQAEDRSLDGYRPEDPEHFGFDAQIFIGDASHDWRDSFDLLVCTPSWMTECVDAGRWDRFTVAGPRVLPESIAVGTGIWFMRRWDRAEFEEALRAVCAEFSPGPDWGSVAARIGRVIPWEYRFRHDKHVDQHFGEPFPLRT